MRFRRSAPAAILLAVAVVLGAVLLTSIVLSDRQRQANERAQFEQLRAIVDFNLRSAEERALARAELIAAVPGVQAAFAARDRERLLAETREMYRGQADKFGIAQAQFHLAPAISFLRLNAPAQAGGEDLSSFRPLVVATNDDVTARKGLSVGRSGPGIFGVVPMHDAAGAHTGSFEVGIDFGTVLDKLKGAYGIESALFFDEKLLREVATGMPGDVLDEHNRVGAYLKIHSTHWALMQPLVQGQDLARVNGSDVQYLRSSHGTSHAVVLMALRNAQGVPLGIVAAGRDLGATQALATRSRIALAVAAIVAFVLLAVVTLVTLRGFLLRPLAEIERGFAALAAGEPAPDIWEHERLCEELQRLAAHYERLRVSARGATPHDPP
jgi:methyl-accepting chemotaxis protein